MHQLCYQEDLEIFVGKKMKSSIHLYEELYKTMFLNGTPSGS